MTALRIHYGILLLTLAALAGCGVASTEPDYDPTAMLTDSTPFMAPGVDRPPAVAADEATVPDDAEIIGVTADGQSRAYLVSALSGMTTHIANDLLGDVPVSVTDCDRTELRRRLDFQHTAGGPSTRRVAERQGASHSVVEAGKAIES
jgi:hypothetical protein